MPRRPDIFLPVLASLTLHAAVLSVAVHYGTTHPPATPSTPTAASSAPSRVTIPEEPPADRFILGLETGGGEGIAEFDAPLPHRALRGDNIQPGLSRDPVGRPTPRPATDLAPLVAPPTVTPLGLAPLHHPLPTPQPRHPTPTVSVASATPPDAPPPVPTDAAHLPGSPFPQAELDSDPFQPDGSAVIVNGQVRARFGRPFKSVRPHLTFAAYQDMLSVVHARIVMRITTDAAGNVTNVVLLERTGKLSIDQPTEVAMYKWWFQPPTDPQGYPCPDTFIFTITYR